MVGNGGNVLREIRLRVLFWTSSPLWSATGCFRNSWWLFTCVADRGRWRQECRLKSVHRNHLVLPFDIDDKIFVTTCDHLKRTIVGTLQRGPVGIVTKKNMTGSRQLARNVCGSLRRRSRLLWLQLNEPASQVFQERCVQRLPPLAAGSMSPGRRSVVP